MLVKVVLPLDWLRLQRESSQFQILEVDINVVSMWWLVKLTVRHINLIHFKFMFHGLECATMTILEGLYGIYQPQIHHQIKTMWLAKEHRIFSKKKYKHLIIFIIPITLINVVEMVADLHTYHADAILVNILRLVS